MVHEETEGPSVVYFLNDRLYLNITNRCTNNCYFCLRRFKTGIAGFNLTLNSEPTPSKIVEALESMCKSKRYIEVVFCGFGEPTTRLDTVIFVADWLRKNTDKPVRLNTNGHALLLHPRRKVVEELKKSGVDKFSVSLNAHDKRTYNEVCRPILKNAFDNVIEFAKCLRDAGLHVEISTVAIPETNISKVKRIASDLQVGFRIRPYYPIVW